MPFQSQNSKGDQEWTENRMEYATDTNSVGNGLKVSGLVWRPAQNDFVFDLQGLLDI